MTSQLHTTPRVLTAVAFALLMGLALPGFAQRGRGAAAAATTVDAATAATISGKVTLGREAPKDPPIRMDADPVCQSQHAELVVQNRIVVNEKNEIADAFVFISEGLEGQTFAPAETPAVLDQHGCLYTPLVWGMQVGQELEIKNSDPTLHNVHAISNKGDMFNLAMPSKDMVIKQKFREPMVMVKVKCDVHPWMFAFVGVLPHPYFSTTDADGNYNIPNLPPGSYTVTVWQRRIGFQSARLTVGASQKAEVNFVLGAQ